MSPTETDNLIQLSLRLRDLYQEFDQLISSDQQDPEMMEMIREKMEAIRETESALNPIRQSYQQKAGKLPTELQQITDDTIELLKSIMPKLGQLEKLTVDSFRKLFPEIQESVRGIQMRNAYQANC